VGAVAPPHWPGDGEMRRDDDRIGSLSLSLSLFLFQFPRRPSSSASACVRAWATDRSLLASLLW
jgi:hypothetical protein